LFLDRLDTLVLAACKDIRDDGTVILDEDFDIMKAMSTQFHICPRCKAEVDVTQPEAAKTSRSGHPSAPDDPAATDCQDESGSSRPEQREVSEKETKESKVSSNSRNPGEFTAHSPLFFLYDQKKDKGSSSRKTVASIPTLNQTLRRANNLSPTVRSTYFKLRGQFQVGSEFSRALLVELEDRIQAAIQVKKLEEENLNLNVEVRNSYGMKLGLVFLSSSG
jgi:hypothetical protein